MTVFGCCSSRLASTPRPYSLAGMDAKEREAADKLQKLILEELHHRIKNTLATVTAIASQSCGQRPASSTDSRRSKGSSSHFGARTICCCR